MPECELTICKELYKYVHVTCYNYNYSLYSLAHAN